MTDYNVFKALIVLLDAAAIIVAIWAWYANKNAARFRKGALMMGMGSISLLIALDTQGENALPVTLFAMSAILMGIALFVASCRTIATTVSQENDQND